MLFFVFCCFFFQAEDGIRDLVRSRGLGDVYKRQLQAFCGGFREVDALEEFLLLGRALFVKIVVTLLKLSLIHI